MSPTKQSDTAQTNAANWNKPGGGYDQWKQGDPAREKAQPVGTMLPQEPITAPQPYKPARPVAAPIGRVNTPGVLGSFKKGGKVKKTGLYKLHRGEKVVALKDLLRAK